MLELLPSHLSYNRRLRSFLWYVTHLGREVPALLRQWRLMRPTRSAAGASHISSQLPLVQLNQTEWQGGHTANREEKPDGRNGR